MQSITQLTEQEPKLTSNLVTVCATLQKNSPDQIQLRTFAVPNKPDSCSEALVPWRMGLEPSSCWWNTELSRKNQRPVLHSGTLERY